jgi:hypothetical protein
MGLLATATVQDVLDRYVEMEPTSGCYLWRGARMSQGYGMFRYGTAHRWMYQQTVGPVGDDQDVHHKCRTRCCVNPKHLEALSRREHNSWKRSHCKRGHALVGENVQLTKEGWQNCRACSPLRPSRLKKETGHGD